MVEKFDLAIYAFFGIKQKVVEQPRIKPVTWVGSSKEELSALHEDVRDAVGQALFEAQTGTRQQTGTRHRNAKPLSGYGDAGVLEIVVNQGGDTYRTVYTVRWPDRIYVLHVFKKKSKSGRKTPKTEIELIDNRLRRVREEREAVQRQKG